MGKMGCMVSRLAATRTPTTADWHWAAGFYEGEGNAHRSLKTEHVAAGQKDPETLYRMQSLFGGSVGRHACGYQWRVTGARARGFLQSIYGLLSIRRQGQARKCLRVGEFAE